MNTRLLVFSVLFVMLLIPVFAQQELPAEVRLQTFTNQLQSLKPSDPNAAIQAKALYIQTFSASDDQQILDKAFEQFREFYYQAFEEQSGGFPSANLQPPPENADHNAWERKIRKPYQERGFDLIMLEGDYYLNDNPGFMYENFSPFTSPMWDELLYYEALENRHQWANDAALIIPWDDLRERIIFWESYSKKYPDYPYREDLEHKIDNYLAVYLAGSYAGMDNSPIAYFEGEEMPEGYLLPDIQQSFEKFLHLNKDSQYYPLVKEYYQLLESHHFKVGEYVRQFLLTKGQI